MKKRNIGDGIQLKLLIQSPINNNNIVKYCSIIKQQKINLNNCEGKTK